MGKIKKENIVLVRSRNKRDQFSVTVPAEENLEKIEKGDLLVLESKEGIEIGLYCSKDTMVQKNLPEMKFVRTAKLADISQMHKIQQLEEEFDQNFNDKIIEHKLPMKLIRTELSFDEKRLTFYFTAVSRIDFRQLLKDLVSSCHKLIRLEQIGSRDAIKINEDFLGPCGRQVCCQSFICDIKNININMVPKSNLACPQSQKLSGCCGKLMCCLMFSDKEEKDAKIKALDKKE